MASLSNNTTIKVSGAISSVTTTNGATLYTCPANSYAVINAMLTATASLQQGEIRVGGQSVFSHNTDSANTVSSSTASTNTTSGTTGSWALNVQEGQKSVSFNGIYVGPGQSVTFHGSGRARISGVQFTNTP